MKKTLTVLFLFAIAFINSTKINAQPFKVGLFTGFGMSSFEDFKENAGFFPLGLRALYSLDKMKWGSINFGIEFNYPIIPPSFELSDNQGTKLYDQKIKQFMIGALAKVNFLKKQFRPYARLGGGIVMGGVTLTWTDQIKQVAQQRQLVLPEDGSLSSSFGFNIGAGTDYVLDRKGESVIFIEFVFNIVSRSIDEADAKNLGTLLGTTISTASTGYNNWAIQLGYQLGFGK